MDFHRHFFLNLFIWAPIVFIRMSDMILMTSLHCVLLMSAKFLGGM